MTPFPVLHELAEVELQAAVLDGECYRLADAYVPIGVAPSTPVRAAAAVGTRSPRLVAALASAAWVWHALPAPPSRPEFLVDIRARWRPPAAQRMHITESVLRPGDVVRYGAAGVTSPLRTALDLARFREAFGDEERAIVRALAEIGGFGLAEAVSAMERGRHLHGKVEARRRLRAALSPS
ncbi:hypothetical protein H4J02_07595 [Protaetiibacter sp. SSC-01]|uniref:hypothetical protein n=1 Tax=Protaetiibacter sp. SSC-01 TaxID=2759943 RepID=UPI0016576195|nr:hypothetical protein [Protaetiibacter sp. SSC-01]QNO36403.1 hypothetical protein H4J02_07595 [Protaetiibacter sp. SSC-01]